MIRNSIDHGIESSSEREAKGKNPEGTIKIFAYHQGGEVIIEIEDDGKGLDKDKILEKAINKKLVLPNVQLPDEDIFSMIFEPGFSTKEVVTELSGRGVGMDVVKNNIDELGGKVEIESVKNKGSLFKIRLPLTLAIIDGMLVKVGDHIYAIPILSIVESLQPEESTIKNVKGKSDILEIRGEFYPLVRLEEIFKIPNAITDPTKATVIVVETYKGKLALMVDDVIDNQQIVIKKINLSNKELGKFSGATILGTGEVALILDIKGIYDTTMKKSIGGEGVE
jgi:two-component system chemotaxis sensor kinase CheA